MIHKSKQANFNDEISVSATLKLDDDDEERIKEFCAQKMPGYIVTKNIDEVTVQKVYKFENSKFAGYESLWILPLIVKKKKGKKDSRLYDIDKENWTIVADFMEKNFPKILYYENFLFDFPAKIYLTKTNGTLNSKEEEYKNVMQDVLDSFGSGLTLERHIVSRLKSDSEEDRAALEATLGSISGKLTKVIFSSWNEVFSRSNTKGKEIEVTSNKDQNGFYLRLRIKQGNSYFSISERSLGFRWFFGFLLFIMFRKDRKNEFGETLFLLDEPANNLHQRSQSRLLNVFEKLSSECKIIYSTHSEHMIDPKYLSGTYIVRNAAINYDEEDKFDFSETDISATLYKNFVSTYPKETDHYKPVLDAIDYMPSKISLIDNAIYLEGKNDYYTMKWLSKRLKIDCGQMQFYPGASVDKYEPLLRTTLALGRPFLALFDADTAGKKAKKRYINDISKELESHIFTLDDIDSNWVKFSTEDLFSNADKIKILQTSFPDETSYNKSKFNTAVQQLYIDNAEMQFDNETTNNFKKVFNFLDVKLKMKREENE